MFPKTNSYEVLIRAHTSSCYLTEFDVEMSSDVQSYCTLEKYLEINAVIPEPRVEYSETKKNLGMILGLSLGLFSVFGGSIAYTIYWKTRHGFYDETNNEIIDPTKRRERIERM
jgi:hypothetical protein